MIRPSLRPRGPALRRLAPALPGMVLLLVAWRPGPVVAQAEPPEPAPATVRVTATGSVRIAPEGVVLAVGVETFADSARAAAAQNAARVEEVLAALRSLGVPDEGLQTAGYTLEPDYEREEPREAGPGRIVGYRAWNMVRVTLDSVDEVGRLIDAAVAAGANRVVGVSFRAGDEEEAERAALTDAVAKARARAETLAEAAGVRLGTLLELGTDGTAQPVFERALARGGADTPIEPGEIVVEQTVTAVWRLERPEAP